MTRGTVKVKLRPIKLAFLVHPDDKESLLKAIEINTFLWGGMYNPIIPTYRRVPAKWEDSPFKNPTAQEVVSGYLDNFDPDYVIPMGECSNYPFDVGYRKKIDAVSRILAPVEDGRGPNYGVGLFEILNYFFQEELKFQRRYPEDICVPRFNGNFYLFLASVFGVLPENIGKIFWEHFAEPLEAEEIECSALNYAELLDPQKLFLRRMANLYLEPKRHWKQCILSLDATKSLDIMDYWNLRAIGWNVLPVPKQFTRSDETKLPILNLIAENYLPSNSNLEIHHRAIILKSRSIPEDEHQHFLDSFEESKIVSQTGYPRIWDEDARKSDHAECCELEANTAEHDVSTDREPIQFKTLDPEFMSRSRWSGKPCFANEIEWRLSDDKILFAEAIPKGDSKQALSIVESIGIDDEIRLFKNGVVYLSCSSKQSLWLRGPHAEGVVTRWLESKGWTVKLSSSGRVSQQMLQQLGGVWETWILAKKGIIELLGKMNSSNTILSQLIDQTAELQELLKQSEFQNEVDEVGSFVKHLEGVKLQLSGDQKFLAEEFVQSTIQEIANRSVFKADGTRILQYLIDKNVFQLGMKIQCPICMKHSWYSLGNADYELQCPECLTLFSLPPTSQEIKWAYRTLGPFSSPNQADGAYTVLLTLRFFGLIVFSGSAITPLMSFTAKKDEVEIEADLALFFQESKFRPSKTDLIFAECKTFNSFLKKDTDRIRDLGKTFPEAVLVFAKLAESLSDEEKKILCPLVNRSRKNRKNGRPFNPILILTGTELISEQHFAKNWEKAGDIRAKFARNSIGADILELCDLTQQVYLDMEPWEQ